jgi:hypothetical protein
MKPKTHQTLPCYIFGHNYTKSKTNLDQTSELTCSHCKIVVHTDAKGNFDEYDISNKNIQATLQRLYHLKIRSYKPTFI